MAEPAAYDPVRAQRLRVEAADGRDAVVLVPVRVEDGDLADPTRTVGGAGQLDDAVDGAVDLVLQRLVRDLDLGHGGQRLEPHQRVLGAVGVHGGERAVVTRGHGLEHVEGLAAAHLADDDAVGAHAQGVAYEVADGDAAVALDVGRARFEADDVRLLELEFGGVLDGDDALALGDEPGERVQQGRLAGARRPGDDHVELGPYERAEQRQHRLVQRAHADQFTQRVRARETPDGEGGAVEGERRDDHVDALAGRQPGVDHRIGLVHAAVDGGDDALDGLHELFVRGEPYGHRLDPARALDVDLVGPVDHDLGDGGVFEERFEHAEAERLVDDAPDQPVAFGGGQDRALAADDVAQYALQAAAPLGRRQRRHLGEVDLFEELRAVDGDEMARLPPVRRAFGGDDPRP